jgi:hypothetical protein
MATALTGDSPQVVAYRLLENIAASEKKLDAGVIKADKKWVLDTYKECINAVLDVQRWGAFGS